MSRPRRLAAFVPSALALCLLALGLPLAASPPAVSAPCDESVFTTARVTPEPGIELFARTGGTDTPTLIVPGDFLLFEALCPLAATHRLVFYDMRNRGRSAAVTEGDRLTLEADVRDLEAVRRHFGIERAALVGYSYLGKMVVLYALEHPARVERIVQLGPVPMDPGRTYPPELAATWEPPADAVSALRALRAEGLHERDPRSYCEREWAVTGPRLVGEPARLTALRSNCELPNEQLGRLAFHFEHHFPSALRSVVAPEQAARVAPPVLVVHGTLDRNAPYGGGREWAASLPAARLLTIQGAAHAVLFEVDLLPALRDFLAGAWPEGVERVPRRAPAL